MFERLKAALDSYHPISQTTWQAFQSFCHIQSVKKGEVIYPLGHVPSSFCFVNEGLVRAYVIDENGNQYNKKFFEQGQFPGAMSALLTQSASGFAIDALETSQLVIIDFKAFRQLLMQNKDLMQFQIHYLETNWLLDKDAREIEIVQQDATQRYLNFVKQHPSLVDRLAQYHIASHLGITPTQLSRIRKQLA